MKRPETKKQHTGKAPRNKTLDRPVSELGAYLDRTVTLSGAADSLTDLEDHTILGDTLAVMPLLPAGCADLIIADPPYNLSKHFNDATFRRTDDGSYETYTRRWMSEAKRLLRPGGSVYVCCDWRSSLVIGRVMADFFILQNRITWEREKGRGAASNWKNSMEDIWFATAGENYYFNLDAVRLRRRVLAPYRETGRPRDWGEDESGKWRDTCPSNFWGDITVPFWSMAENTGHPTQKPEKLAAKMILASSRPGDLVLDPFLGSGTTSVTAKKLGRRYLGIERDPQYCAWAEVRLERAETDRRIQGYEDGVFWERNSGPMRK